MQRLARSWKKGVRFQTCSCQVLTIIFTCVHVLEEQVMKDISLCLYCLKVYTAKSFKTWKAKSQIVQSLQDLRTWSCKNVAVQKFGYQVLREKCKISDLWLPSPWQSFHLFSCLGRPSHERHTVKSYLYWRNSIPPKKSRTWKAKSWIGAIIVRLGDMELQKNVTTLQNLACQVLEHKVLDFRNVAAKSWKTFSNCVHVLEGQVMKDITLGKGLMLKFVTPTSLKTWKPRLNSAVIVKTWGHWVAKM